MIVLPDTDVQIDPEQIHRFCQILFEHLEGYVALRFIGEKGTPEKPTNSEFPSIDHVASVVASKADWAARQHRAVFLVPGSLDQGSHARADDVRGTAVVLVDLDECDVDAATKTLSGILGRPSLIVASGGTNALGQAKAHLYWRLTEPAVGEDLRRVSSLRGRLADAVSGDRSFASLHQPIRVPGTIHGKNGQSSPVRIVEDTGLEYELDDLIEQAERLEIPESPKCASKPRPALPVPGARLTAAELATMPIREGAVDGITRFKALSKVIGHYIRQARTKRMTLDEAWIAVCEHNAAMIRPPWEETRLRKEFEALLKRDRENASSTSPRGQGKKTQPEPLPFSEDSIADQVVSKHGPRLRYVPLWNRWFRWTGKRWVQDDKGHVADLIRRTCRSAALKAEDSRRGYALSSEKTFRAVLKIIQTDPRVATVPDDWDADDWLVNTPDGAIDLRTGEHLEAAPDRLLSKMTVVPPGGPCPIWLAFLDRITGGDAELIGYLQRFAGYCLTGATSEQMFLFLFGPGANGKSIFISTLGMVLDDYAATATLDTFMASRYGRHLSELAGLHGARLVAVPETEASEAWSEARIKTVTGGEKIRANFMRQDHFEYLPKFKLVVAGNHRPRVNNSAEAMRRRLHAVPLEVTIPPEERDPRLLDKLRAEAGGILAWMIDGCADWQQQGLAPPDLIVEASANYLLDEDLTAHWLEECCDMAPGSWEASVTLFASWRSWAEDRGELPGSSRSLGEALRAKGFQSAKHRGVRGWVGVSLKRKHLSSEVAA